MTENVRMIYLWLLNKHINPELSMKDKIKVCVKDRKMMKTYKIDQPRWYMFIAKHAKGNYMP